MKIAAQKVELNAILALRALFLEEANHQVRHNSRHERGWSDSYLLVVDGQTVGYGSIMGREIKDRDTVFEYFVIPSFRNRASDLFAQLIAAAKPAFIECQSNDQALAAMLFEFAHNISADTVLFEENSITDLAVPGVLVRRRQDGDAIFSHGAEPVGEYVAELNGEIVATGGFLLHYNHPFADLYMEVREDLRRRGVGSFLLQEVKRECYLAGRVPAARTSIRNLASRACLGRAGLRVCGFMLTGEVNL
ncbi:MAG: GNAT family N-acetyltransferase [Terracidiphilus sp.]|jgi:GNAT superfamily N-acetyltransferase